MKLDNKEEIRDSSQKVLPAKPQHTKPGMYNIFPDYPLGDGKINIGFEKIADIISDYTTVIIDGYAGVLWDHFRQRLHLALRDRGIKEINWIDISDVMLSENEVMQKKKPYLGGDDPVFGNRYTGNIMDFFAMDRINNLNPDSSSDVDVCILYGCGAALAGWEASLMYIDLPKNELQYRSRTGSISNLGRSEAYDPKKMYKEFYFVDWIVLNKHKANIIEDIDWVIDGQRPAEPAVISGRDFRSALESISENVFRVRPWFEPGVWGGQWCKQHISQLPKDIPNYAWSFEMIVPENGLALSSGEQVLEVSFDWLMYRHNDKVLGESAKIFGYEFPIRFDFLDTFDGGNLSLQCHPRPQYIKDHFGESFTQDETYYILDCKKDAEVYLGFREDIDPKKFREQLKKAEGDGSKVEVENYVLTHPAEKHDLFLIPSGTVHCSGVNNLVLEISATPYIYTFKMYDWQRLDLDGNPRPINIERAFENLQFDRKGQDKIEEEFISTPEVIGSGVDWQLVHLPTHPEHFYDIHRYDFETEVEVLTRGSCHIMNLVEGSSIILETQNGVSQRFNYAETFTVPAAAGSYRMINEGDQPAKVVQAFVKSGNATNLISS